jgi:hypothetical protein
MIALAAAGCKRQAVSIEPTLDPAISAAPRRSMRQPAATIPRQIARTANGLLYGLPRAFPFLRFSELNILRSRRVRRLQGSGFKGVQGSVAPGCRAGTRELNTEERRNGANFSTHKGCTRRRVVTAGATFVHCRQAVKLSRCAFVRG